MDNSRWYEKKVHEAAAGLVHASTTTTSAVSPKENPPVLPIIGWKKFLSKPIPSGFYYGTIYEDTTTSAVLLLIDSAHADTVDFGTDKPMQKGLEYFRSGFVVDMEDCNREQYYFVKASVCASY